MSGLSVAVVRDGEPLARHREEGRGQAARLVPAIAETLAAGGIDRRALSLIAVSVGPGSFTGVRVGLAAARGLGLALGIPIAGLATTAVLLAQASPTDRLAVAVIDSHLGDWFCAIREGEAQPFVATAEDLRRRLAGRPSTIVGPDAGRLAEALDDAKTETVFPDPVAMARLARQRGGDRQPPRPLYLRGVNVTLPDGARRTVET